MTQNPIEQVILVDSNDQPIGTMEKLRAHEEGLLHRAFSVFVFNSKGELLIHQRAAHKYHSGGLWTNTCCSHPRPGEETEIAAHRRLMEEMGMQCSLEHAFSFTYKSTFDNNLTEHEFDHVFVGTTDVAPVCNPQEVQDYRYVHPDMLDREIADNPEHFTTWFRICYPKVRASLVLK
jgi:isopentenyl-diphosphate delta-isomerase